VIKASILGRLLGLVGNPPLKAVKTQVPAHAINASRSGVDDLRAALLREWLQEDAPAARPAPAAGEGPRAEEEAQGEAVEPPAEHRGESPTRAAEGAVAAPPA
jgi:hypothetical protein